MPKSKRKDWGKPGDLVEFKEDERTSTRVTAILEEERCWQCRKYSLVNYICRQGWKVERCLNDCGPRGLLELLKF